ncbi:hypothetical protein H257_08113 [Aphanomyces astaci]|uniref:Uncharacterized protein n=1 Tax=Aphanomyces astaci TaxID=112090 RepID=W4GH77_APHAT|nr:hypothetical protein H257_08113 [Aphanomyces astaci]ETV78621.1 hypothetical protein H257_08113 [Aphanomyces astaci]|eukprot:XP_009832202.1 hypothetical protein H257_08113 [Aphanomyces astaci]
MFRSRLSDGDKALLRFACCTYNLKRMARGDGQVASSSLDGTMLPTTTTVSEKEPSPPPSTFPPCHASQAVDRLVPRFHGHVKATSSSRDAVTCIPPTTITDTLLDLAAEFLYSDRSSSTAFNTARVLRMAFQQTDQGFLRPTPACEKIVLFWCDFLLMGLRGDYASSMNWTHEWPIVVEVVDALVLNYAISQGQHPSTQRQVSHILNSISEACMTNRTIGLTVLEWAMELVGQLALK